MATINISRQGHATGVTNANFNTARGSAASSVTDGITGDENVQYFHSGRGKRFQRVFLYFDTSSITGTLSAAHIDVTGGGVSGDPNDTIMIKSTAFGGDGGTALATTDFFLSLDYSTAYSTELTSFSTSGNNEYTLTAAALADIKNNDHFTLAIVEHDSDYTNSDQTNVSDVTIDFDATITLDYTLAGYGHTVNGVASANIGKINGVATASISKVNGV
tara:strand:+ start:463 stop:1116 length:654 start_codon:yes stop_codon:yes gene_type:complete